MRRTYVDITAEYYDNDEVLETSDLFYVRDSEIRKALRNRPKKKIRKFREQI